MADRHGLRSSHRGLLAHRICNSDRSGVGHQALITLEMLKRGYWPSNTSLVHMPNMTVPYIDAINGMFALLEDMTLVYQWCAT